MNVLFISLGCDKNRVDSEEMIGLLRSAGHNVTDMEEEADVVVITNCSFIRDAKDESVETIIEMCDLKKQGVIKGVIVTGCLAEQYKSDIREELTEIDAVLGTTAYESIVDAVNMIGTGKYCEYFKDIDHLPKRTGKRVVSTGTFMAYLKIAEGCDKHCTYCIIPKLRGGYRSIPMEELIDEAKSLAENGVKELTLVAQEITVYGVDIYGKKTLPELLKKLSDIDGIEWIRLLYCYPEEIDEELVNTMATLKKVCHYIDMPIQHASDDILKRMGRKTSREDIEAKVAMLRSAMPDICIRTTLIAGFPGETEKDHEECMSFVQKMCFDRLGVFSYSREDGTPAASFDDQIEDDLKDSWRDELMELQSEISYDNNSEFIGRELSVMIEGYLFDDDVYVGRSYRDCSDVDGYVFVSSQKELLTGSLVNVIINDCSEYDLYGQLVEEEIE